MITVYIYCFKTPYFLFLRQNEKGSVDWMYKGNKTDREEYLLGKKITTLAEFEDDVPRAEKKSKLWLPWQHKFLLYFSDFGRKMWRFIFKCSGLIPGCARSLYLHIFISAA
jgi:hypothetical protein